MLSSVAISVGIVGATTWRQKHVRLLICRYFHGNTVIVRRRDYRERQATNAIAQCAFGVGEEREELAAYRPAIHASVKPVV